MKILEMIKKSDWKQEKGVDPNCIVLLKIEKGAGSYRHEEYTTHEMVMRPGKKEPEFHLGHYFTKLEPAVEDFKKRTKIRR
jgi:hypothetical protein